MKLNRLPPAGAPEVVDNEHDPKACDGSSRHNLCRSDRQQRKPADMMYAARVGTALVWRVVAVVWFQQIVRIFTGVLKQTRVLILGGEILVLLSSSTNTDARDVKAGEVNSFFA